MNWAILIKVGALLCFAIEAWKSKSLVALGLVSLGVAAWLVLSAFQKNLVFFFTPTQVLTGEAQKLAEVCVLCAEQVQLAVRQLSNMDNASAILKACEEIDRLESEADHIMRAAMAKLFRDEADVRQVIKMKAIYELLETVTDRCEDVANIIEGIVLENA